MNILQMLQNGRVGVIPTDTIYGLVGSALIPDTVERIYRLRRRNPNKPFIILISSLNDLNHFNIKLDKFTRDFLEKNWPNPLSVVLSVTPASRGELSKWNYLTRGTKTLAFRMPNNSKLLDILKKTGPLVAPSANFEGSKPAETIDEAKGYFGNEVDFYVDGGKLVGLPSTLVAIKEGKIKVLRQGIFTIIKNLTFG